MQDYRVALCLAAAAALLASTLADGASTIVGGGSQWSTGVVYPPISAILGETLVRLVPHRHLWHCAKDRPVPEYEASLIPYLGNEGIL